jgi:hypothetical protein
MNRDSDRSARGFPRPRAQRGPPQGPGPCRPRRGEPRARPARRREVRPSLVEAGVDLMAETTAILSPEKTVTHPGPLAQCAMAARLPVAEIEDPEGGTFAVRGKGGQPSLLLAGEGVLARRSEWRGTPGAPGRALEPVVELSVEIRDERLPGRRGHPGAGRPAAGDPRGPRPGRERLARRGVPGDEARLPDPPADRRARRARTCPGPRSGRTAQVLLDRDRALRPPRRLSPACVGVLARAGQERYACVLRTRRMYRLAGRTRHRTGRPASCPEWRPGRSRSGASTTSGPSTGRHLSRCTGPWSASTRRGSSRSRAGSGDPGPRSRRPPGAGPSHRSRPRRRSRSPSEPSRPRSIRTRSLARIRPPLHFRSAFPVPAGRCEEPRGVVLLVVLLLAGVVVVSSIEPEGDTWCR